MGGSSCQPKDLKCNRPKKILRKEDSKLNCSSSILKEVSLQSHEILKLHQWIKQQEGARELTETEYKLILSEAYIDGVFGWVDGYQSEWWKINMYDKTYLDIGCGGIGNDVVISWVMGAKLSVGIDINIYALLACRDQLFRLNQISDYMFDKGRYCWEWMDKVLTSNESYIPPATIKYVDYDVRKIPDKAFDLVNCSCAGQSGKIEEWLQKEAIRIGKEAVRINSTDSEERIIYK